MNVPKLNLPPRPHRMSERKFLALSNTAKLKEYKRMHEEMWNNATEAEQKIFGFAIDVLSFKGLKKRNKETT
jgi:hypothetical protein